MNESVHSIADDEDSVMRTRFKVEIEMHGDQ